MDVRKLFQSVVGRGLALTAILEIGASSACTQPPREGPPPGKPCQGDECNMVHVQGRVVGVDGKGVAGATVQCGSETTTTREDGQFFMKGLPVDGKVKYTVTTTAGATKSAEAPPTEVIQIQLDAAPADPTPAP